MRPITVKPVKNGHSQKDNKMVFKTNYRLMLVKSIAECSKGSMQNAPKGAFCNALLLTFIKLPVVIKTFVLSIFEWPFYTGFTVRCEWIMTMSVLSVLMHLINLSQVGFTNHINKRILI